MLELPERIGRYRVVRRLGAATPGNAFVARADDAPSAPLVVLKTVAMPDRRGSGLLAPSFVREATAYARLVHPGIVKVLDFFSNDGRMVLAFELVDGRALNVVRAGLKRAGEALDDRSAAYVASRVFAALGAAHGAVDPASGGPAPVVHRDLNPSRILLQWDGEVKITSFGIAKTAAAPRDSQPGTTWGSYGYLAPEQVKGEPVTPRSDVYSAAVVLWEMLTGRKAIERGTLGDWEVLKAMQSPKLPSLDELRADLPQRVRDVLRVALDPLPERRAVSADELAEALVASFDVARGRELLVASLEKVRPDEQAPSEGAVSAAMPVAAPVAAPVATPIGRIAPPRPGSKPAREELKATEVDARAESPGGYRMVKPPSEAPVAIAPTAPVAPVAAPPPKPPPPRPERKPQRPPPLAATDTAPPAPAGPPPVPPPLPSAPRVAAAAPGPEAAAPALASMPPAPFPPTVATPVLPSEPPPAVPPLAAAKTAATPATPPTAAAPATPSAPATRPTAASVAPAATPATPATSRTATTTPRSPLPPAPTSPGVVVDTPAPRTRSTLRNVWIAAAAGLAVVGALATAMVVMRPTAKGAATALGTTRPGPAPAPPSAPASSSAPATVSASATAPAMAPAAAIQSATASAPVSAPAIESATASAAAATASAIASAPATVSAPATDSSPGSAAASAPAPASAAPPASPADPAFGDLDTSAAAHDHRIYVDGHIVGETPAKVRVRCGSHEVKIGSHGAPRTIVVPCGGSVSAR